MSDYVLFQMSGSFRQSLIAGHAFYVDQARRRLLSQFDDISAEADKAAEDWLDRNSHLFDSDRHDPGEFDEAAYNHSIEYFGLLTDMRDQTRLSVVAGMFHEWDKQLRGWLVREIGHWHVGDGALKIWSASFVQITDLLESLGWKIRSATYFRALDACRLVINVYKHGEGNSLDELRQRYPEYLSDPFSNTGGIFSDAKYRDHTHLKVDEDQFKAFADAIIAFWKDVPESVLESMVTDVPDWFGKAILKDRDGQRQTSKK